MENSYVKSQNSFISRTLLIMGLGLLVTFAIAVATSIFLDRTIAQTVMLPAFAGELLIVFYLSRRIEKLSINSARLWFFAYALLNGFTLSVVLSYYEIGTAAVAFGLASAMFFSSAMIGMTTKRDLTTMGRILIMGVVGLVLIGLVGIIFPGAFAGMNMFIALLGIAIFCGLTAYDMQQIKYFHQSAYAHDEVYASKFVIIAALSLYLDFINIFLYVLRLLRGRD